MPDCNRGPYFAALAAHDPSEAPMVDEHQAAGEADCHARQGEGQR
jgi:hypothetical protein